MAFFGGGGAIHPFPKIMRGRSRFFSLLSSRHMYVGRCRGKRGKEGRSVASRRSLHPLSNSYIRHVHSEKREDARSQKLRTSSRLANERNGGSWLDKKKRQRTENSKISYEAGVEPNEGETPARQKKREYRVY